MNKLTFLTEIPVPGKPLGRHVEHDERSREYGFFAVAAPPPLKTVTHRRYGGVFDQGELGSCTGNAAAGAMNTLPLHRAGEKCLHEKDAVAIYSEATLLDSIDGGYPPDDTGSSGLAVAKALRARGLIRQFRHAFSVDEALAALMAGPVITGVSWYQGFDHPDARGLVKIDGQDRGGHEFEVVGYQSAKNPLDALVICVNSWGTSYGVAGRFKMTVRTWATLLEQDGDVTILFR